MFRLFKATSLSLLQKLGIGCLAFLLLLGLSAERPLTVFAASSMYVTAPGSVKVGDTVNLVIGANTNGDNANTFDATISYPSAQFDFVRGSRGSVCSLYISEPGEGGGEISCGRSGGYTGSGTVYTLVLTAKAPGNASIGLSGCTVLANDGHGTDISGGCSGTSLSVAPADTATPPPASVATPTPTPPPAGGSVKPTPTPKPSPTPAGTVKPVETPHTETPTPTPTLPPVQNLPASTATPTPAAGAVATPTPTSGSTAKPDEHRTISRAFTDLFSSLKDFKSMPKDTAGALALSLTMLPLMALFVAALFLIYRLYFLEKRRKRTLDRLFEMELSELAALEGKMDLLAEKGDKGREEYRDEFEKTKEHILRQIRPDYGKPVDPTPAKKAE